MEVIILVAAVAFAAGYLYGRYNNHEELLQFYYQGKSDAVEQVNAVISEHINQKQNQEERD